MTEKLPWGSVVKSPLESPSVSAAPGGPDSSVLSPRATIKSREKASKRIAQKMSQMDAETNSDLFLVKDNEVGAENLTSWNPMKDDYSSGSFNSYNEVTRGSEKKCDTLFIDHIPITLTADGLKNLFSDCGKVVRSNVIKQPQPHRKNTYGFVKYSTIKEATKAYQKYDGYEIGSQKLSIKFAKPEKTVEKMSSNSTQCKPTSECPQTSFSDISMSNKNSNNNNKDQQYVAQTPLCTVCKSPSVNYCSVCGVPYCSTECQRSDWKNHKLICQAFTSSSDGSAPKVPVPTTSVLTDGYTSSSEQSCSMLSNNNSNQKNILPYDHYLKCFDGLPLDYSLPVNESVSQFYALPLHVISSVQMNVMPLVLSSRKKLESLLSFQHNDLQSLVKRPLCEILPGHVYGCLYKGIFCRILKSKKKHSLLHFDTGEYFNQLLESDLFALPSSIFKLPPLRYIANLSGMESTVKKGGVGVVKGLVKDSIIVLDSCFPCEFKGSIPNISCKWYSFDRTVDFGSLLKDQGYAANVEDDCISKQGVRPLDDVQDSDQSCNGGPLCISSHSPTVLLADEIPMLFDKQKIEGLLSIYPTAVESPCCVWAQLFHDSMSDFQSLVEDMNTLYLPNNKPISCPPSVGGVFAAKFVDECFYRAEVLSVDSASVKVRYVDYGNVASVNFNDLSDLFPSFLTIPKQALQFSLAQVIPVNSSTWSLEACQYVRDVILEKPISVDVLSRNKSCFIVNAYCPGNPSLTLNDVLIEKGMGKRPESIDIQKKTAGRGSCFNVSNMSNSLLSVGCHAVKHATSHAYLSSSLLLAVSKDAVSNESDNEKSVCSESVSPLKNTSNGLNPMNSATVLVNEISTKEKLTGRCPSQEGTSMSLGNLVGSPVLTDQTTSSRSKTNNNSSSFKTPQKKTAHSESDCSIKNFPSEKQVTKKVNIAPKYKSLAKLTISSKERSVCISHVVSPREIYVQLAEQPYINHLETVLHDSYEGLIPFHPQVDDVCVTKFSDDQRWYRALVIALQPSTDECCVQFIDYGNFETISLKHVMNCPVHLISIPVLAIKCSLDTVYPPSGDSWDLDCARYLMDRYSNKVLLCHSVGNGFDLFDPNDSINVVQDLISNGYAQSKTPDANEQLDTCNYSFLRTTPEKLCSVSHVSSMETASPVIMCNSLKMPLLPCSTYQFEAIVLNAESPLELYILPIIEMSFFMQLAGQIEHFFPSAPLMHFPPVVGQLCLAESNTHGIFRGEVMDVKQSSCLIKSIDYGSVEEIKYTKLKQVNGDTASIQKLSLKCAIAGMTVAVDCGAILEVLLKKFTCEHKVSCQVYSHNPLLVDLFHSELGSLHQYLSLTLSLPPLSKYFTSSSALISSNTTHNIIITYVKSPQYFWVQIADQNSALKCQQLYDELQEYCQTAPPLNGLVTLGQSLAAKFEEDHKWYRAQVIDVCNNSPTVRFIDFGNVQKTSMSSLLPITDALILPPAMAILCMQNNVPKEKHDVFKNYVQDSLLQCSFNATIGIGMWLVTLSDVQTGKKIENLL